MVKVMNKVVQVQGHPYLVKDTTTGAILNKDAAGLQSYKKQKQVMADQHHRLNKLESDMSEIKQMLQTLVSRK